MKNIARDNKSGFTIVELTLTMAFIGILLIAIAVITTNILAIYQKGTTLKAVNNTGRDLIDNFTNAVTNAPSLSVKSRCSEFTGNSGDCESTAGFMGFTFNEYRDPISKNQLYGVFCTGLYSYAWNTEYTLRGDSSKWLSLRYNDEDGNEHSYGDSRDKMFRLIRIEDPTRRVCSATVSTDYETNFPTDTVIDARKALDSDAKLLLDEPESDLLTSNDVDLVLYELTIFPYNHDDKTGHNFYSGTFILGTRRGDLNIQSSGEFCNNSSASLGDASETAGSRGNLGAEFNYCAINKFNFAVRSAGE